MKLRIFTFIFTILSIMSSISNAYAKEDIGITPKQFSARVNKDLKSFDFPALMPKNPKIVKGDVNNTAQAILADVLGVTMIINKKTGNVKSVSTILTLTDNDTANLMLIAANSSIISSFAGDNEYKELGKKFFMFNAEVVGKYADIKDKEKGVSEEFSYKGMKFGVTVNSLIGIRSFAQLD
ncbi:hypothetical protein RO21_10760 [[Actinobacillus] muris]|uniref:DUF1439 domain-containing protein n=1 Tax=Muribacter muris TaxID=67855 RepID=A0A0J5P543_9PAST|nr:hypothetical protein [Muribacter muris]KMK50594.1 hypothetical protein RO21_10760 [[Actinobacillus] muris] [Muribacter muris]